MPREDVPAGWNAADAIAQIPVQPFEGHVWRAHWNRYPPLSAEGSRYSSGRYNRHPGDFPNQQVWLALYVGLRPEIPWAEITRHSPVLPLHNQFLLSEILVRLERVIDCRQASALGLEPIALVCDQSRDGYAYWATQEIALAALQRGIEGILVPSATLLGDALVIFPANLRPGHHELRVIESREMRPYSP